MRPGAFARRRARTSRVVDLQSKTVGRGADNSGQTRFAGIRARDLDAIRLAALPGLAGGEPRSSAR